MCIWCMSVAAVGATSMQVYEASLGELLVFVYGHSRVQHQVCVPCSAGCCTLCSNNYIVAVSTDTCNDV